MCAHGREGLALAGLDGPVGGRHGGSVRSRRPAQAFPAGTQVGHLPRQVVTKLSPLMDRGLVNVEGIMHEGNCKL